MKRLLPIILSALAACAACTKTIVDEHMVVEGWIEEGGYPEVYVTSSMMAEKGEWAWESLMEHVLVTAAVSVSDGEKTEFLTGRIDKNRFPPYVFTTTKMKGEAGKTYTLHVKYGKTEAEATTTVPEKQELTSWELKEEMDGASIVCSFDAKQGCYYKFYSNRMGKDLMYLTSFLAMVDGSASTGPVDMPINRGYDLLSEKYKLSFDPGDKVSLRFCTMDKDSFDFWNRFEEQILFSKNPLVTVNIPVQGNVDGAYGYWIGYGASYYTVDIPE